ncbi:phospholipase D family protein [Magnetospirillum fulvum]|nr:phospholipase D family protein [Magnetospirillum fulvum]
MRAALVALALLIPIPALAGQPVSLEALCFTPGGDCTGVIVDQIGKAQRQVLVQAYNFTDAAIVKALIDAKRRGVDVQVVIDRVNVCAEDKPVCRASGAVAAGLITRAGIPLSIDRKEKIAHNKVMVIDGHRVITGSFNFSQSAQKANAENLLVIEDEATARRYAENWRAHQGHSQEYQDR